jgi:predicted nucleotidyltransferase
MKNIFINAEDHAIISRIIHDLPYPVLVFGSRIKGTQQPFSDLDLCLKADKPIPLVEIAALNEALHESNLPFTVDVTDYYYVSDGFKKIIDRDGVNFKDTTPTINTN